ncbi:MAG: NAD(P)H-dependent oxidoreductase [Candidatus Omnitrophica bacterium]|nr:NAD(P)H-dependent oxidoreductase [Candidatus Omnitrophota bacterium]
MKHLVIYSHPNPKSFNNAIVESFSQALKDSGNEVKIRDLYAMKFNPVLNVNDFERMDQGTYADDVLKEQEFVRWADVITFVFPIWWNSSPAITRGYVDRVFSVGFAYTEDMKGLLPDKKVLVICTLNAPEHISEKTGAFKAMNFTLGQSLANFCGMTLLEQKYFSSVASVSSDERKQMLENVKNIAKGIR